MWKLIASGLNTSGYIKCLSKLLFDVERFFAVWLVDLVGENFAIASYKVYAEVACKVLFAKYPKYFLWSGRHGRVPTSARSPTFTILQVQTSKGAFEHYCHCKYNTNTIDIARQVGKPKVGSNEWLEPMAMLTECTNEKYPLYLNPKIMFHCNYRIQLHCNHESKLQDIIEVTSLQFE